MPFLAIYGLNDITTTGPNPWPPGADSNPAAVGNTTLTLDLGSSYSIIEVVDNDAILDDFDGTAWFSDGTLQQELAAPATINGTDYLAGQTLENEYSYVIRPVGSSDPADDITVYVLDEGGATPSIGLVTSAPLTAGVTYEFVGVDSDSPAAPYSELFACFGPKTRIETPAGSMPIEDLKVGDSVLTLDNGAQKVRWIGRREVMLDGVRKPQTPLFFPRDSLGPDVPNRDLVLSPNHRVLVLSNKNDHVTGGQEVFVQSRALVKRPGVRKMQGKRSITYYSVLLDRHEVILANGMPCESFYPSTFAQSLLTAHERLAIAAMLPHLTDDAAKSFGPLARRDLSVHDGRRLKRKRPLYEGRAFNTWANALCSR